MPTEQLTPDNREAVRAYIRRYFAVSALVATIAAGVLVFALNHVVLRNAQLEAQAALSKQLDDAELKIASAVTEAENAQKHLGKLTKDVDRQSAAQTAAHAQLTDRLSKAEEKYIKAASASESAQEKFAALATDVEGQREEHTEAYDLLAQRVDEAQKDLQEFADSSAAAQEHLDELTEVVRTKIREIEALQHSLQSAKDLADAMRSANTFVATVSQEIVSAPGFLDSIVNKINEPNIYLLKAAPCGKEHRVPVPVDGTETNDWLVFGINPSITSMIESRNKSGDNAVFSFSTSIRPNVTSNSWVIDYRATVNYASTSIKKLRIKTCPPHIAPLQLVAVRAYNGLQEK